MKNGKKEKDDITTLIQKAFNGTNLTLVGLFILLMLVQAALMYFVAPLFSSTWTFLGIATLCLFVAIVLAYFLVDGLRQNIQKTTIAYMDKEMHDLRIVNNRARSLQQMASTLRATLSFEQVVVQALDVCGIALGELGVPPQSLIGAIFLFDRDELVPVATRRFLNQDKNRTIKGKAGIVGLALKDAEPAITTAPRQDPELKVYPALQNCQTVICVPLRAGFQIFGAMVIGTDASVTFNQDHLELFDAVADQSIIALQNAQLFQTLEREKQRIIHADEEARKELARDLHDGPTQSIAAIAMRINFIRTLLQKSPEQVMPELEKVEELAKQTSKDIRGMLFTLRPLVLETQGLARALETVIKRLHETDGLNIRMIGDENADLINEKAQSVIFSIVEEALGNARKYSKAKQIEVKMWQEDNLFVVAIQDDGVGFEVESVTKNYSSRGSLGMINMRERAERINASLKLDSAPGKGTKVTVVVPLDKNRR